MSNSKVYWNNREKLYKSILRVSNKEMATQYKLSAIRIRNDMEALYNKIMSEEDPLASHIYRYQEYYETVNHLNEEMKKLGMNQEVVLDKRLTQMYNANSKLVSTSFGLRTAIDTNAAQVAIRNVWVADGKTWSERIWKDKMLLEQTIELSLVDCVASGLPKDRFIELIMYRFNVSFHNALRLVRTELSHVQNQSAIDRYKDAGIEMYEFIADGPNMCPICSGLNHKMFPLSKALTGVNMAPMHCNCVCGTLPVIN